MHALSSEPHIKDSVDDTVSNTLFFFKFAICILLANNFFHQHDLPTFSHWKIVSHIICDVLNLVFYFQCGRLEEAVNECKKAVIQEPVDGNVHGVWLLTE